MKKQPTREERNLLGWARTAIQLSQESVSLVGGGEWEKLRSVGSQRIGGGGINASTPGVFPPDFRRKGGRLLSGE